MFTIIFIWALVMATRVFNERLEKQRQYTKLDLKNQNLILNATYPQDKGKEKDF